MNNDQFIAPEGVVITSDPAAIPAYGPRPCLRTPLRRSGTQLDFVLLEQPTKRGADHVLSVPDALGINGDTQIGLSRASRIMQGGQTSMPVAAARGQCDLCGETQTAKNRPALEVDNKRPFGPLLHKVVFSKTHIERLNEVSFEQVLDSTEQFYEIAEQCASGEDRLDGLAIGMNFGEYASSGATQIHFHYQVAGLSAASYNPGDRLAALCQAYRQAHAGADYLADYEAALRRANLIITEAENGLAFTYAPISPRFKGELQIILRRRHDAGVSGNILETTLDERVALAELQLDAMQRFARLGCEALNQVWFMTRFSAVNDWGQRLVISICPRTSIIAFYELFGNSVIDVLPWVSAATLRADGQQSFSLRA